MKATGGCYCGEVRYEVDGEPVFKGQCHCRECQYFTGGQPNTLMSMAGSDVKIIRGETKGFKKAGIENAVTREFCSICGTHMWTKVPSMPGAHFLKVGTLDDMSQYEGPQMAIFMCDTQPWHPKPEGIPTYDKVPG